MYTIHIYSCTEKTLQWSEINFGEDITNNQTEKKVNGNASAKVVVFVFGHQKHTKQILSLFYLRLSFIFRTVSLARNCIYVKVNRDILLQLHEIDC